MKSDKRELTTREREVNRWNHQVLSYTWIPWAKSGTSTNARDCLQDSINGLRSLAPEMTDDHKSSNSNVETIRRYLQDWDAYIITKTEYLYIISR